MEFRVLGPLEVVHDGEASAPPGVKERTILARLLLEPARVVPTDALIEAAWPETDPETAARSLAVRLANLRAFLEPGALEYLSDDCVLEREPLEQLAADGALGAYRHEGYWRCLDTYKAAVVLEEEWNSGSPPWRFAR